MLQDALGEVMKVYPPLKLKVFVDDITAFMDGRNKEGGGRQGLEAVDHGRRRTRNKNTVIASCSYLEENIQGVQEERRRGSCNHSENIGCGLEDENETAGSK